MQCVFCRGAEAIHLEKGLELCQTCIDVRDSIRAWHEENPNQTIDEYVGGLREDLEQDMREYTDMVREDAKQTVDDFLLRQTPSPTATVH